MSLTPQEEYVEAGYFVDDDYVGGIAEAVVGISPYVVEDYIESGYFIPGGSFASVVCDLTQAIEDSSADLNTTTTMSCTALRIKTSPVQLSWQATLDGIAAVFKDTPATLTVVAQMGHLENGAFANNVEPAVTYTGAADLVSTSTISADGLLVVLFEADVLSSSSLTANAIEYQLRANPFNRPINFIQSDNRVPSTTGGVEGGYSGGNFDETLISEALGADLPDTFLLMFNYYTYWQDTDEEIMTYGDPSSPVIRIRRDSPSSGSNRLEFVFANSTGNDTLVLTDTDGRLFNTNQASWVTIFISRYTLFGTDTYTIVKVVVDGDIQKSFTTGPVGIGTLNLPSAANRKFGFAVTGNNGFGVDDFVLYDRETTNELGWGLDPDTQGLYTSPTNDVDAIMYHRFNGDLLDETSIVFELSPTLNIVATVDASGTYTIGNLAADLNALGSTLVASVKTGSAVSSLDSNFTLSCSGGIFASGECNIDSATQMGTTGTVIFDTVADLNSTASITADVVFTAHGESTLLATASCSASVTGFSGTSASLGCVSSATATATRIKSFNSNINSSASVNANGDRTRITGSNINSTASLDTTGTRIKSFSSTLTGIAATLAVAVKSGAAVASLDSTTSLTGTANAEFIFEATLNSTASTNSVVQKTTSTSADLTANSSLTCEGVVTVGVTTQLEFTSSASVVAVVVKTTDAVVLTSSSASLSVLTVNLRPAGGDFVVTTQVSASPTLLVDGSCSINSTFNMATNGGKLESGAASIQGAFSASVLARTILTSLAVYVVPRETRSHTIAQETRSHTVTRENRTHKVLEGA